MDDDATPPQTPSPLAHVVTPPPLPGAGAAGPVRESERIVTIDALRGFALLGIFLVNMQFFAMPIMQAVGFGHPELAPAGLSEKFAWAFVKIFCEYKFISLFSLLFGIGLVIQSQRAAARGRSLAPTFLRRLVVLACIGLVHAFLLWYGDILFFYAVIGVVLLAVHHLRVRTLVTLALASFLLNVVLAFGCASLQVFAAEFAPSPGAETTATDVDAGPPRGFAAMQAAQFDPSRDAWIEAERLAYREGPLGDAVAFRSVTYGYAVLAGIFGYGWRILAMFLLGAALMKAEFFAPSRRAWHKRFFAIGLGVGLPLEMLAAAAVVRADFAYNVPTLLANALHDLASFAVALGYLGLVCLLVRPGRGGLVQRLFVSGGRLALSVYLFETIITTGIMYWWGLGRFGTFTRPELLLLVCGIYAALLVAATIWLRVFSIGPFEWLWRSLTYLRPQPFLRRSG